MRKSGYYWVRKGEDKPRNWHPLPYDSALCCWWYKGATLLNSFWDEIDETPIERKSVQSEEKERRELLQNFLDYVYEMALAKTKIGYDKIVDRFLESEKGGEG